MAVRGISAISFSEPLQLTTSGAESEFIYSVWTYVKGLVLYPDLTKIPFTATFYNWMFYVLYGEISGTVLRVFSLSDDWLPTITRLITLAGGIIGSALAYHTFVALLKIEGRGLKVLSAAFAIYLFFGPLPGFFAFTTRPDTWAIVFDIGAIFVFLVLYREKPLTAVLLFCGLTYAAWSFKQIFVFGPGTVGLFLLLNRDWRHLAVLVFVTWSAWGLTLWIGGPAYTQLLFFRNSVVMLSPETMVRSFSNFSVKFLPGLAGLAAIVAIPSFRRMTIEAIRRDDVAKIAALGLLVTTGISLAASLKEGAAEYYFLPQTYYIALLVLTTLSRMTKTMSVPNVAWGVLSLGWVAAFLAVASVLMGFKGVLSVRYIHEQFLMAKPCLQAMKQPAFVSNSMLSLPWIMPAKQHFVLHYHYLKDHAAGIKMEQGGIGGLMDKGYFATLALYSEAGPYDGSDLKRYRARPQACPGMVIYDRINGPAPDPDRTRGGNSPKS
jgi:hypothetical protein